MSLFLITGVSGSGKSEVALRLKAKGYEAYDTDDDGLARWQDLETGYIHPKSSVKKADRTKEFIETHIWKVPREFVEPLAKNAKVKPVFLCGTMVNEDELRDMFEAVFALVIDDATLKHRLATRTSNDWGKQPHELQQTLEAQQKALKTYRSHGYSIIDANQPVAQVIQAILEKIGR